MEITNKLNTDLILRQDPSD